MTSTDDLKWSVIEKNNEGNRTIIARFFLVNDAELFAKTISGRMVGYRYFVTSNGTTGLTF